MKNAKNHAQLINPVEQEEVTFWTKKWGISRNQLNNAIMETGSLEVYALKNYLINKGLLFSIHKFTHPLRAVFKGFNWR